MIAIGKKGPREKLPPKLQEKEFPNDRKPLSETVMEGNFEEKNTYMNNLRTARLKILNNSVLPAVTSSMPKNSGESGEGAPARSAAHLVIRCLENEGVVWSMSSACLVKKISNSSTP
jgi:hypothetical protein